MIRAFTAGPNWLSNAFVISSGVGSIPARASRRSAIIGQTISSAYCADVMPRSCWISSIHLSRGTLKRRDIASISASTSCGVTVMPCRWQA